MRYPWAMYNQIYPTDLTDRQLQCIMPLLPSARPGGRPRSVDMAQVINAILSILVTGAQWRMLPKDYPKWQTVSYYFRRWRDDGTWQRIHDMLRAEVRRQAGRHKHPTAGCLDSPSVKTTQVRGVRGDDKGNNVNGRKRHVLVDTMGLLLAVVVTAASTSDPAGARVLFARIGGACKQLRRIWVDGTYRGTLVDWGGDQCQFLLQPVLRSDNVKGFLVLPRRWVVERTFAWLTQCRRLGKDYEGLPASSEAMIYIAMTRLMIRRLAPA
jgi:putative transposase